MVDTWIFWLLLIKCFGRFLFFSVLFGFCVFYLFVSVVYLIVGREEGRRRRQQHLRPVGVEPSHVESDCNNIINNHLRTHPLTTMSSSSYTFHHDVEKNVRVIDTGSAHSGGVVTEGEGEEKKHSSISYTDGVSAVPGESFEYGNSWYAKMQRLAGKLNVEQRGIERVPENERTDDGFKALLNVATMVCCFFYFQLFSSLTRNISSKYNDNNTPTYANPNVK